MNKATAKKQSPAFVGLKDFRRNVAKYAKQAQSGSQVVVTNRNKPLFMVTPLSDDIYTDGVLEAVAAAEADVDAGRVYTEEAMRKKCV